MTKSEQRVKVRRQIWEQEGLVEYLGDQAAIRTLSSLEVLQHQQATEKALHLRKVLHTLKDHVPTKRASRRSEEDTAALEQVSSDEDDADLYDEFGGYKGTD